jgi:hypothetical protein
VQAPLLGVQLIPNEIEAEAVLENCHVLIKQIIADLSAEKALCRCLIGERASFLS